MINKKTVVIFLLMLCMTLGACGEVVSIPSGPDTPGVGNPPIGNVGTIEVSSVSLNSTDHTLKYGESFLLVPTVRPYNATNAKVTFTVDSPAVCELTPSGNNCKVTAVGAGQAIVTATCNGRTSSCRFTVTETNQIVEAEAIKIYGNVENILVGTTRQFSAIVLPENATDKTIEWFSSNTKVATVDENGLLTAIASGDTVLSVSTADGRIKSEVKLTIVKTLVVPEEDRVTRVDLNAYNITLRVGETFQLIATPYPATAPEQRVWYVSENKDLFSISKTGLITALAPGKGKATAGSEDGKKNVARQCTITILPAEE